MKDFLNKYMATNRNLQRQPEYDLKTIFSATASVILQGIGEKAFRPKRAVNAAVVDSLMYAVAKRLDKKGEVNDFDSFKNQYTALIATADYMASVETGTSQEANVEQRISLAEKAFAEVQ